MITYLPHRRKAFTGGATTFGGASREFSDNNYLEFPSPVSVGDDCSVALWIKRNGNTINFDGAASWGDVAGDGNAEFIFATESSTGANEMRFYVNGGYRERNISIGTGWHHFGASLDYNSSGSTDTAKFYMDGSLLSTYSFEFSARNDANWYIGNGFFSEWIGWIADFRLYNSVLSDSDMADLAAGTDVSSGLQRHYLGNDDSLTDLTGNGPTLTETGTTTYSTDGPLD